MNVLISKQALIKDILKSFPQCGGTREAFVKHIQFAPTIEAEPVKHGQWKHLGGDEWCCTNCGDVISTEGSWDKPSYKYCHECGAKMDK